MARKHHHPRNSPSFPSLLHTAMSSTTATQGSPSVRTAANDAAVVPADRPYLSTNASSSVPSTASASANTEVDATLLDARGGPTQLNSASCSSASSTAASAAVTIADAADVDAGANHPHQPNVRNVPPPQLNPASLDTSASVSAAAATSLLFATPKGRGGGGAHGPALVVFSGGTAFNVVAGEVGTEGGRMTKVMGWVTRVIVTSTCPLKLTD